MASPRASALAALAGALGLACGACGGATDSGLFAGGSLGAVDGSAPRADGSAPGPGHDAGPGTIGEDAGSRPHDAGPQVDATPPPFDAAPPGDPGILCDKTECDPKTQVCCRLGGGAGATSTCVPPQGCTQISALPIPCDDTADCLAQGLPSTVCCVTDDPQTGTATMVACVAASACSASNQTEMCDPAIPNACPSGLACKLSTTTIPGYSICR